MTSFSLTPPDPALLKRLGRAQLQADRLDDAMLAFAAALRQDADDLEAQLLLGDCYLAQGHAATAYYLYLDASNRAPGDPAVQQRLALARAERRRRSAGDPAPVPTDAASVAEIISHITGSAAPISEAELERAAATLEAIVTAPSPAAAVAANLETLSTLVPALLELNIRQARSDGRPDLAEALQGLQDNIRLQLKAQALTPEPEPAPASTVAASSGPALAGAGPRLVWTGPDATTRSAPFDFLQAQGYPVAVSPEIPAAPERGGEVLIASNPHLRPEASERLPAWIAAGGKLVVWLDTAIEQLPERHPEYARLGLTTRARQEAYATALHLADAVVVPSQAQADLFIAAGRPAWVVPPAWDRRDPTWHAAPAARPTVHLGWASFDSDAEDLASIRRVVMRLLREYAHTRLVILGDAAAYQLFETLPAERRLFVPITDTSDYAYALGQVDILLAPMRDTAFNHVRSDQALMAAGVRRLPWVAPPTPAHLAWAAGGLIGSSLDEWYAALQRLILDPELRRRLGLAGRQRAEERELNRLGPAWLDVVEAVTRRSRPGPREAGTARAADPAPARADPGARLRLKPQVASYLFGSLAAEARRA